MKVAALFSGGKDSVRAVHHCLEKGYEVKYLVTMLPRREDSWLFHVPNIHLTELSSEAIGIPLISKETSEKKEEEIEDLRRVLKILEINAVACGGMFSSYQKNVFGKICKELNMKLLTPFWHEDPEKFLKDTIDLGFDVRIIGVYAEGFDESWLGRRLDEKCIEDLRELNKKFSVSMVGEGGEFESIVLDGPIFKKRIEIINSEKIWDAKTQSGYLKIKNAMLAEK